MFGSQVKSMVAINAEKVSNLRQRLHQNGAPKMQADLSSSNQAHNYRNESIDMDGLDDKRKRHRRTATEIQRHYACPVAGCHKSYGSEGSMNQHMKLKHVEFYRQQIQCGNL